MPEKIVFWIPRTIGIGALLLLLLFSFDCFEGGSSMGDMLTCFVMHNLPSFLILALLIIFWKNDLALGIIFFSTAVLLALAFDGFGSNKGVLIITAPLFLAGAFNFLGYFRKKRRWPSKLAN